MSNIFLPAVISFGPFFVLLLFFTFFRIKATSNEAAPKWIGIAMGLSLLIGTLGILSGFLIS